MQRHLPHVVRESDQHNHGGLAEKSWRGGLNRTFNILALVAFALGASNPALSQAEQTALEQIAGTQTGASQAAPPLSKFEARRIRHRCRDQVSDINAHRELHHCFEMHVAARRLWGECKRKPQIAILHGHEKDEAVTRCALEKLGTIKAPLATNR